MYGMGAASLAESIKGTVQEAQEIIDNFYKAYPNVKKWIDETNENAKKNLYVEDYYGRRRRLKDLGLPRYTIRYTNKQENGEFNPLLNCLGLIETKKSPLIEKYTQLANECNYRGQVNKLKEQAAKDGIEIIDNNGFIARAERQCVNARIQGGAATMSKIAMRKVYDNEELRKLGFSIVFQVHDELIGECPAENADRVAEVLSDVMKNCVSDIITVPFKCDADIAPCWYYSEYSSALKEKYDKMLSEGKSPEEAFQYFVDNNSECTEEQLRNMIYNN